MACQYLSAAEATFDTFVLWPRSHEVDHNILSSVKILQNNLGL